MPHGGCLHPEPVQNVRPGAQSLWFRFPECSGWDARTPPELWRCICHHFRRKDSLLLDLWWASRWLCQPLCCRTLRISWIQPDQRQASIQPPHSPSLSNRWQPASRSFVPRKTRKCWEHSSWRADCAQGGRYFLGQVGELRWFQVRGSARPGGRGTECCSDTSEVARFIEVILWSARCRLVPGCLMVTWVASSCGDNRSQTKSMFWTCKDWSSRRNSSWRADSAAWWQSCGESQSWWLWFQECQPTCGWAKGLMLTRHLWSIRTTRRKCSSAGVRRPLGRHVNRGSGTIRSSEAPAQSTNGAGWHCTRTCWLQLGRRDSGQCHRAAGTAGSWRSRSGSERGWGRLIRCRKWHLILIAILPVSTYRFAQKLDRNQVCEVAQLPMCRTDMDHCSNYTLCESKRYNKKSFCKYKQYVAINEIYPFNIIACCICWRRHGRMAANLVSESESERDRRGRGTSTSLMKRPGWRFGTGDTGSKWPTDHRFQSPPHKLNSRNRLSSAALQILCWVLLSCFDLPPKYSAHKGNFKNEKLKETAVRIELSPLPHVRSQSETSILESWAFSFSMLFFIVSPSFHIFSCFKGRMNFASVASQLRPSVTQHRRTRTTTGPWHGPTPGEAQDGPGVQHSVLSTLDWTTGCLGIDGD